MKIMILHNTFIPEYGGSSIRAYNLLSRIPYDITVITPDRKSDGTPFKLKYEKLNQITIKRVNALTPHSIWRLPLLRYFYHEKTILNAAKKEHVDLIQSRNMPPYIFAAYKSSKNMNKPLIIEAHPIASKRFQYYTNMMNIKKIFKHAKHVISLTEAIKRWVMKQYQIPIEKITVIKNGVNSDIFKPQNTEIIKNIKEKLGNPDKIIMYAGYFDKINGFELILNNIPSILSYNPHINFLFIGQGPYFQQIKKMAKEYPQIKLLTSVKHEFMPAYYQTSDIFIIPRPSTLSSELVTPLKLLEAMSTESIVLGSDVGGITDVVEHEINGYLYKKDSPKSFHDSLMDVIEKNNNKIGKNARKTILKEYNWDKSAKKLQNVYDSIKTQ